MQNYDVLVIGAGIVGLATALKILEKKPDSKICVLEKESSVAAHQTGNNSGVIHSGIYYKPGSLKATNCKTGYKMLLNFCDKENIPYELCGKVIVATSESEIPALENIYNRGLENGLDRIKYLTKEELKEYEPYAKGVKAVLVPYTGIIDFKIVSEKYAEKIKNYGGEIYFNQKVKNINQKEDYIEVLTANQTFISKTVINCAGLFSDEIASLTYPGKLPVRIIPFRGEYYKLKKNKTYLVNTLIYPVPDPSFPFLGVHFTKKIGGDIEAGPNAVLSFKKEGYKKTSFSLRDTYRTFVWKGFLSIAVKFMKTGLGEFYRSFSKRAFVKALQKLLPEITINDITTGGAGVRAQACSIDGKLIDDFLIYRNGNVINVCNAPSPAATASLAIGEHISSLIS
ncbi:MAG TPA: L-2-hydroxyglutarate oxidase [Ignavibacteria bacterium]